MPRRDAPRNDEFDSVVPTHHGERSAAIHLAAGYQIIKPILFLALGLIAVAFVPVQAFAESSELPPDIKTFLDRVERCERAARLESYASQRREEIYRTYENLGCRNLIHDEAALREAFADNDAAIDALDTAKHGR